MEKEQVELKVVEYAKSVGWEEDKIREYIILNFCKKHVICVQGNTVSLKTQHIIQKYKPKRGRPKTTNTITPGLRVDADKWKAVSTKHKGRINKMFNDWIDTL